MTDNQHEAEVQDVTPERARRRIAVGVALALTATVLSLLVAEGVLRGTERYATASELAGQGFQSARDFSRFRIPWIGFDSGTSLTFPVTTDEFDYVVRTNVAGVRGDALPPEKQPDELRVVVLGDSFVASHGVAWEDAWTEVLERDLAASLGIPVTVIAGGVPGHDPVFSYHLLRLRLLPHKPDLVLLMVNPSDLHDVRQRGGLDRFGPDGLIKPPPPAPRDWVMAHSHLARALFITTAPGPAARLTLQRLTAKQVDTALVGIVDAAEAISELGRTEGYGFMMATHPLMTDFHQRGGHDALAGLAPRAEARGLHFVKLRGWFVERLQGRRPGEVFFPVDQHFNEEGYDLLAEAVGETLAEAGLLPSPIPSEVDHPSEEPPPQAAPPGPTP